MAHSGTQQIDRRMVALARSYWAKSRRYYSDSAGRVGLPTGPLRDGNVIVWCVPGPQPGMWLESGSTLTPEGAASIRF